MLKIKAIILLSSFLSLLNAQDDFDLFLLYEIGSVTYLIGSDKIIDIQRGPGSSLFIGQRDTKTGDSFYGLYSSDYLRSSSSYDGQIWEDFTRWDEQPDEGSNNPSRKISGLRNSTQSDSLDMFGRRIRQD